MSSTALFQEIKLESWFIFLKFPDLQRADWPSGCQARGDTDYQQSLAAANSQLPTVNSRRAGSPRSTGELAVPAAKFFKSVKSKVFQVKEG